MRLIIILYSILLLFKATDSCQEKDSIDSNEKLVCYAEGQPKFQGGFTSLKNFIKQNLKYPRAIAEYEGSVFVEFIVNEDGSLTDFKIIKGLCNICDSNAIETLKKMPKWTPARVNNKAIKSKMIVPVNY
jgi:protein TonB